MVGKRIENYLNENGIKKSFLAEKAGITKQRLTSICKAKTIDCITYYKICKALNQPLEAFLEGEE